jgi:hypothetical protein
MKRNRLRKTPMSLRHLFIAILWLLTARNTHATDYFLTISGGYSREANQASLEANVQFFRQILKDKHPEPFHHDVYFANGDDPTAEVQVMAPIKAESDTPATDLLASLYRRPLVEAQVTYRKHQLTELAGPLDPKLIRSDLEQLAKTAHSGDRLIVYVTSHGSPGAKDDRFDTSIDCWNAKKITAREFSHWLDKLPADVPVVMVMAQCYCGGFGHLIFQDLNESQGLAAQSRVGFFAQQHDLPAAGCRPDIEHDEEFSSYFWGALEGHSRNGVAIEGVDINGDGVVSFAEAYAYAVTAGDTVDIPLRTSEVFLRKYSRLKDEESQSSSHDSGDGDDKKEVSKSDDPDAKPNDATAKSKDASPKRPPLAKMDGSIQSFVDRGGAVSGRIVTRLSQNLGLKLDDDVTKVQSAAEELRRNGRFPGRGRGGRGGAGRRDLLKEVADKWPELGDERHWKESPLLKADNQKSLLADIQDLPSWKAYDERRKQMAAARKESQQRELREVKFRRLLNALETINLEKNLPLVAEPDIVARYRQIVALEESSLVPGPHRN